MNDFQNQPGGGFGSVGGYNDIAGSQAEEQQRMQEDELNRQRMDQASSDAAAVQAESQASYQQPSPPATDRRVRRSKPRQTNRKTQNPKPGKTKSQRPVSAREIQPGFAILGFAVAGIWGMSLLEGDGRWFSGVVVGLMGAHFFGYYHKIMMTAGLVGAGWWFFSQYDPSQSLRSTSPQPAAFSESVNTVASGEVSSDTPVVQSPVAKTVGKPSVVSPIVLTPEQEVVARYPYPSQPALLLRPHQDSITDPTRMREFRSMMLEYEEKTGKSFLTDHRSMKPVTRDRFDYFSRYSDGDLLEGQQVTPKLSPIQGVWDYSGTQLWELDLKATVDQQFIFRTKDASGNVREGVFRTYSGDGLCYQPMTRPLSKGGRQHERFQVPVQGGEVWRGFVRSVYVAETDAQLLALDPINLAIAETHRKTAVARSSYQTQLRLIDQQREASLPGIRAAWNARSARTTR
ncbi:hypothetical protein SAMN06265222_102124 [Neorhodopirellula lusitana]|uniref:Uncharacterized protein n=1 Tax=Neorhodopirellula lusitana TaxID=445327 RepID=A0ABY1PTF6_9BACT|nr:hypothetical protein [Neorhodopirellula lusitana]SMP46470.1 hypothetical protein SAMN06265222_102124 [Neorhodopirellula lusitana]